MNKHRLFVSLLFLFVSMTQSIRAATIASGTCGKDNPESVLWELTDEGVLTISGKGPMTETDVPWQSHCYKIKRVIIEDGVTAIGPFAFVDCLGLLEIEIGNTVQRIGDWAFESCMKIEKVVMPPSVVYIGKGLFYGCSKLRDVILSDSVPVIGDSTFLYCKELRKAVIGKSVVSIGKHAFRECTNLQTIDLPSTLQYVGEFAFNGCANLTSIYIPNSVISIGRYALPHTHITVGEDNPSYCSIQDVFYTKAVDTLIFCARQQRGKILIPNTVRHIKDFAFGGCKWINDIFIPNSVITIGKEAFTGCDNLLTMKIPESVSSIDIEAFWKCKNLKSVFFPKTHVEIGKVMFHGCKKLKKIYLQCVNPDDICDILYSGIKKGQCTFYVPKGSGKDYKSYTFDWRDNPTKKSKDIRWGEFGKIVEYDYCNE